MVIKCKDHGTVGKAINYMVDVANQGEVMNEKVNLSPEEYYFVADKINETYPDMSDGDILVAVSDTPGVEHCAIWKDDEIFMISGDEDKFINLCDEYSQAY